MDNNSTACAPVSPSRGDGSNIHYNQSKSTDYLKTKLTIESLMDAVDEDNTSLDAMNEYLLENMHQLQDDPGSFADGDNCLNGSDSNSNLEPDPSNFLSFSSSDEENEVLLVWRPSDSLHGNGRGLAAVAQQFAPQAGAILAPNQVNEDFIDIDMLPLSQSQAHSDADEEMDRASTDSQNTEAAARGQNCRPPAQIDTPVLPPALGDARVGDRNNLNNVNHHPAPIPTQLDARASCSNAAGNRPVRWNHLSGRPNGSPTDWLFEAGEDADSESSEPERRGHQQNRHRLHHCHPRLGPTDRRTGAGDNDLDERSRALQWGSKIAPFNVTSTYASKAACDTTALPPMSPNIATAGVSPVMEPAANTTDAVMLLSEQELSECQKLTANLPPTSCAVAALVNVLRALNLLHACSMEDLLASRSVCSTAETSSSQLNLVDYLLARSHILSPSGCCGADQLVTMVTKGRLQGLVRARFFAASPERRVSGLASWLKGWLRRGAVPVLMLNLQRGLPPLYVVPDLAWTHQVVYGVTGEGIHMTNPIQVVPERVVEDQLCSESVLLVRKTDIHAKWTACTDLAQLAGQVDPRWNQMNVLGQVICALRETEHAGFSGFEPPWAHHIRIPCAQRPGVTVFVPEMDLQLVHDLFACSPDLPLQRSCAPRTD